MRNGIKKFVIFTFVLIMVFGVKVFAQEGFTTDAISVEQESRFLQNTGLTLITHEPPKRLIHQFDVREDGLVVICAQNGEEKTISVYTTDGDFEYGFTCRSSGTVCAMWNRDCLDIVYVRDKMIVTVRSDGTIESVREQQATPQNNQYYTNFVLATERTIHNDIYAMKRQGFSSFSEVIVTDVDGNERVVYHATNAAVGQYVILGVLALVLAISAAVIVRKIKNSRAKISN